MSEQPTALPQPILDALACSRFLRRQLDSRSWLAPRLAASIAAPLDATTMRDFLRDELGLVLGLRGANAGKVIDAVKKRLAELAPQLPPGVSVVPVVCTMLPLV